MAVMIDRVLVIHIKVDDILTDGKLDIGNTQEIRGGEKHSPMSDDGLYGRKREVQSRGLIA
ncbi:uncharacterized protein N7479_009923 [Penicillium vulpinum]|uniref:uncharacterized protein n=1 Tax=Penicillium vulpinum TaxID=29845 RepID=UPI0025487DF6|nr:uncharacterized protein N7479_009923 [Penicillium vulpinum]KAJ5951510.1 hypothetical protein N7479_009923 [Penicillium vulpinum]